VQLEHSFSVPVGVDEAWQILLDIERVGRCMPGAAIQSINGDEFTGTVKVKLGPINLTYKGQASFVEKDEAARRAVIKANGRDARGNGTASARVTATLTEAGESTSVQVNTDLNITGKPAQFGRGVMADVGNKLLGQFADNLAATINDGSGDPAAATASAEPVQQATPAYSMPGGVPAVAAPPGVSAGNGHVTQAPARLDESEVESIDLIKNAGPAVAKRLAVPAGLALVVVLLAGRRRQRRR